MRSEQDKEEEMGMPTVLAKDSKTKMPMAKVGPSKGVNNYSVEVVKRMVEQLGDKKVILKGDNESAILALRRRSGERERERERDVGISLEEALAGEYQANRWRRWLLRMFRASLA